MTNNHSSRGAAYRFEKPSRGGPKKTTNLTLSKIKIGDAGPKPKFDPFSSFSHRNMTATHKKQKKHKDQRKKLGPIRPTVTTTTAKTKISSKILPFYDYYYSDYYYDEPAPKRSYNVAARSGLLMDDTTVERGSAFRSKRGKASNSNKDEDYYNDYDYYGDDSSRQGYGGKNL